MAYAEHLFSFTLGKNALELVGKYKKSCIWSINNRDIFVKNH